MQIPPMSGIPLMILVVGCCLATFGILYCGTMFHSRVLRWYHTLESFQGHKAMRKSDSALTSQEDWHGQEMFGTLCSRRKGAGVLWTLTLLQYHEKVICYTELKKARADCHMMFGILCPQGKESQMIQSPF